MTQTAKKAQTDPDSLFWFFGASSLAFGINELWYREVVAGLTHIMLAGASFMLASGRRGKLIPAIAICSNMGLILGGDHPYSTAFAVAGGIIGFVIGYVHDLVDAPLPSAPSAICPENAKP